MGKSDKEELLNRIKLCDTCKNGLETHDEGEIHEVCKAGICILCFQSCKLNCDCYELINDVKTSSAILDFINTEIPFNELKKDKGIFETNAIEKIDNTDISIGISYENDDNGEVIYIYNIFIGSEYINISSTGNKKNKIPDSVINEIRDILLGI